MSQAATTVFPKAVVAARTPVSCRSKASAAACCSGRSAPVKGNIERVAAKSLIADNRLYLKCLERFHYLIQTASWQGKMLWMILGAGNNSWFVVSRQAHGLRAIELRVLKRGQTEQPVAKGGREVFLADVDLVSKDYFELFRQRSGDGRFLSTTRWRRGPGILVILVRHGHAHPDNPSFGFRVAHQSLDLCPAHSPHRGQERPLIGVWPELFVKKNSVAALPGLFLEGKRNQVSEPAFGQACPDWETAGRKSRGQFPDGFPSSQ